MKEYIVQATERETIDTFEANNTPELIRCRDCKYKECIGRDNLIVCDITGESHGRLWFCADGERAEAEANDGD